MKQKYLEFICALFLTCVAANAQAGLFGPSNYEECVLEKIKGTEGDAATRAIQEACYMKFLDKEESKALNKERQARESLRKKCGISEKDDGSTTTFLASQTKPRINDLIAKLKSTKLELGNSPQIKFQNNNPDGISGVMIGVGIKGKSCSNNIQDYDAVFYCGSNIASDGIPPGGYGSISCPVEMQKISAKSWCIVGLRPRFNILAEGMSSGMNRLGLCD